MLALLVVAGVEAYSQIQAGRLKLSRQYQRMNAFEKQNKKNIERLQNTQQQLLTELKTQNQIINDIEIVLNTMNDNIENSDLQINCLTENLAENEKRDESQIKNHQGQLAKLQSEIKKMNRKQNKDFNNLTIKILSLSDTIFSNECEIKDFISEYGTRKMRKNIEVNEVETFTVQKK